MADPRREAIVIIKRFIDDKAWIAPLIRSRFQKLSFLDFNLLTEIVYGVVKNFLFLREAVSSFLKAPFDRLTSLEKAILLAGSYELLFLEKIPPYAAVYSYVEIAKQEVGLSFAKLTNAILRRISREGFKTDDFCVKYSVPKELYLYLKKHLSETFLKDFFAYSLSKHPTYIRLLNPTHTNSIPGLENVLFPETYKIVDNKIFLDSKDKLNFVYQDLSSQVAQHLIPYVPRGTYLDLTSAPCNKASFLAQKYPDITVIANDLYLKKLRVFKNSNHLSRLPNLFLTVSDATVSSFKPSAFDVVIIDAPCSGLGTLRRKPELKHRLDEKKFEELIDLQKRILLNAKDLVKPNGFLVYMTCTINPAENELQIKWFLERGHNFIIYQYDETIPFAKIETPYGVYVDGAKNDCDFFFVSILKKGVQ